MSQQVEPVEPAEDGGGLQPGVYFLELTSPGKERFYAQNKHFLNVSSAVLTVKQTTDRLTVWAVDVDSGAPIAGERIQVYGKDAALLGGGITDERGIVQIDIPYTPDLYTALVALLDTDDHFGIGYSNWSNGTEPWQFGYNFAYFPRAYQTYFYTDRPVYRTGQPVYFRGIVRSKDDVVYMPPPFENVPVTIRDARGEIVYQEDLPLSDFGSFNGIFDIAPDASLGSYSISVKLPSANEYVREGGGIGFLVAEYRLPEYQVTLATERPQIARGETATFNLEGRYFFGGAVSNAAAEYTVFSAPFDFNYTGDGVYDFTDYSIYERPRDYFGIEGVVTQGQLQTDAKGAAQFDLVGELGEQPRSSAGALKRAIRDEGGQTIFGSSSLIVHQGRSTSARARKIMSA